MGRKKQQKVELHSQKHFGTMGISLGVWKISRLIFMAIPVSRGGGAPGVPRLAKFVLYLTGKLLRFTTHRIFLNSLFADLPSYKVEPPNYKSLCNPQ